MDALEKSYQTKHAEYEKLIAGGKQADAPKIASLNTEIAGILTQMLTIVGDSHMEAGKLKQRREELQARLTSLQSEAIALRNSNNDLIVLQAAKDQQTKLQNGVLFWYSIGLGLACLLFVLLLSYKFRTTSTSSINAPAMPPLMYNEVRSGLL
jgi:hypothetical protein